MKHTSNYRFIDHGGDIEIEVFGSGYFELFNNCISSTADIMVPVMNLDCESQIELSYRFSDRMNLLVQVLNDIIGEFEVNDTLYFRLLDLREEGNTASVKMCGHKFGRAPESDTVLKAVTYHDLKFDPDAGNARITFDI